MPLGCPQYSAPQSRPPGPCRRPQPAAARVMRAAGPRCCLGLRQEAHLPVTSTRKEGEAGPATTFMWALGRAVPRALPDWRLGTAPLPFPRLVFNWKHTWCIPRVPSQIPEALRLSDRPSPSAGLGRPLGRARGGQWSILAGAAAVWRHPVPAAAAAAASGTAGQPRLSCRDGQEAGAEGPGLLDSHRVARGAWRVGASCLPPYALPARRWHRHQALPVCLPATAPGCGPSQPTHPPARHRTPAVPVPRSHPAPLPPRSFKGGRGGPSFKRLPYTHCAISFQPFEDAVRAGGCWCCRDWLEDAGPWLLRRPTAALPTAPHTPPPGPANATPAAPRLLSAAPTTHTRCVHRAAGLYRRRYLHGHRECGTVHPEVQEAPGDGAAAGAQGLGAPHFPPQHRRRVCVPRARQGAPPTVCARVCA